MDSNRFCIQKISVLQRNLRNASPTPNTLNGEVLIQNMFTKYLTEIISSDELLFLHEMETRSLENREEINDVVLAALCWLDVLEVGSVSRSIDVFH